MIMNIELRSCFKRAIRYQFLDNCVLCFVISQRGLPKSTLFDPEANQMIESGLLNLSQVILDKETNSYYSLPFFTHVSAIVS